MLIFPEFDPIALSIGPFAIRWYGISYLLGFIGCYWLSVVRGRGTEWTPQKLADVLVYVAIGIILGGRIGYVLFYHPATILDNPLTILAFWEPGRSFHGGMLGVIVALFIFAKYNLKNFIAVTDFIAPAVPIGLGFGRLGNFINGELYGRVTDLPWGMVFPSVGPEPRHPSQLYELFFEGFVMCIFLVWYARKPRKLGAVSGMFLISYGIIRCAIEVVREPDEGHLILNYFTMGQLLSIPMIILGLYLVCRKTEQ